MPAIRILFQCTAHQCCGLCICIRVRPCLSPKRLPIVSPTFHVSDERIRGVVFVFGAFWFVWVPFLAVGIRSFDVIDLELAALLLWSLYALVACRASLPCSICFTCSV